MQHIFIYAALSFVFLAFCYAAYKIFTSDIQAKPSFQIRLEQLFAQEIKPLGSQADVVLERLTYFQSGESVRRMVAWRVLRAKNGEFFSFRATVRDDNITHSTVKVGSRQIRRWLFWHPVEYKKTFGHSRRLRDIFPFGFFGGNLLNQTRRWD